MKLTESSWRCRNTTGPTGKGVVVTARSTDMDVVESIGSESMAVDITVGCLDMDVDDCSFPSGTNVTSVTSVEKVVRVST